jgi:hypothetical protein
MIHKYERNEQLRCMDYIDTRKMKKLFVGTNRGVILTIDITAELEYDVLGDQDYDMEMDMDYYQEQIESSPKKSKKSKFEESENEGPSITH